MSVYEIKSQEDIQKLFNSNYKNIIIDHYGSWCSPCKYLEPKYEELAKQYSAQDTIFTKCDAELKLFPLKSLPTIEFYVHGKRHALVEGADVDKIKSHLHDICIAPSALQKQMPIQQLIPPQQQNASQNSNPYSTGHAKQGGGTSYKSYKDL